MFEDHPFEECLDDALFFFGEAAEGLELQLQIVRRSAFRFIERAVAAAVMYSTRASFLMTSEVIYGPSARRGTGLHYSRYGNRRFGEVNTTPVQQGCPLAVCNPQIDPSTNKLIGYTFDSTGNTTTDAEGKQFTYDAENKQTEVKDANGYTIGQYFYDGDGKRIKKAIPASGETTVFVYDASGKLIAEYSTIAASPAEAKASYLTNDHLGSPRITTDASGQVISRRDFMPFGEEIFTAQRTQPLAYTADNIRQKFTGYERDTESGLDYAEARYYSNQHGRFTSTDPLYIELRRLADPQKINLYVYARNNPLLFIDPNGLEVTVNDKTTDGTGDDDYMKIVNGRKDAKFQVDINNKNKVIIVDAKGNALSKADLKALGKTLKDGEKELFNAITDTKNNATVNIVRDDPDIFYGAYEKKGENTIDVGDAARLNNPLNAGGRTAYDSIAHETLEAFYTISKNLIETDAHQMVNPIFSGLGFYPSPSGGNMTRNTQGIASTDNKFVTGWRGDFDVPGISGRSERITFEYVTPIPRQQFTNPGLNGVNIKSVSSVKE